MGDDYDGFKARNGVYLWGFDDGEIFAELPGTGYGQEIDLTTHPELMEQIAELVASYFGKPRSEGDGKP